MGAKQMQPLLDLSRDELEHHLGEMKEELFNLRFRNKMRQLDNSLKIRDLRRQIARAKTILTEADRRKTGEQAR